MLALFWFLVVFSLLIFAHEWGHFIVAKKRKMTVHEFGFGFPPRLVGIQRVETNKIKKKWRVIWGNEKIENGATVYSINWLPVGGFVQIKGEGGEAVEDRDSFASRKIWERAFVIVAGVLMNVVLGWALFTGGFIVGTPTLLDSTIPEQYIRNRAITIRAILPHSPATTIDLRVNDIVVKIGDKNITSVSDLQNIMKERDGKETTLTIKRDATLFTRSVTPQYLPDADRVGIGVGLDEIGTVRYPIFTAFKKGTVLTGTLLKEIVVGFYNLFRDLIVQRKLVVEVMGPIGIAQLTGKTAERGIAYVVQFIAILSLNLAVLNVLPIPALDGGRLLFLAIEKVRRKTMGKRVEALIHRISFALLILLVLLVTYKDIARLVTSN